MAITLKIKQPSVHKIERQTDLYLSTLRRYVEAAGGTLELRVKLPGNGVMQLTGVGDLRHPSQPLVTPRVRAHNPAHSLKAARAAMKNRLKANPAPGLIASPAGARKPLHRLPKTASVGVNRVKRTCCRK